MKSTSSMILSTIGLVVFSIVTTVYAAVLTGFFAALAVRAYHWFMGS